MRSVIAILLLFLVLANSTFANFIDKRFRFQKDTNAMAVKILDDATGGCWTNLLESKKYAEDKLQLLGVNLVDDQDFVPLAIKKTYRFKIFVHARRSGGWCEGNVFISIETVSVINGKLHLSKIYENSAITAQPKNINNDVLQFISIALRELK